jgi:hypothetical protein
VHAISILKCVVIVDQGSFRLTPHSSFLPFHFLIGFLQLVGGLVGFWNIISSFAPHFGFCSSWFQLGSFLFVLLFSPLLGALFNGACQGFTKQKLILER